jgi:metal-dependent HD superfamily phosphatase/phosphodiesterase
MNKNSKLETLEYELLKLDSWYKALEAVDNFFDPALYDERSKELKCEEMVKNYYAMEKIFTLFYRDYGSILESIHIINTENIKIFKEVYKDGIQRGKIFNNE